MFRDGFLKNCPKGTLDNNKCYVSVMLFWKKQVFVREKSILSSTDVSRRILHKQLNEISEGQILRNAFPMQRQSLLSFSNWILYSKVFSMSHSLKKKRHRSKNQRKCALAALQKATSNPFGEITNNPGPLSPSKVIHNLKHMTTTLKIKVERIKHQYWNERQRNSRLRKATEAHKVDLKKAKNEAYKLRGVVESFEKRLGCMEQDAASVVQQLNKRFMALEDTRKDLNSKMGHLRRKCQQLRAAKHSFKQRAKEKLKLQPVTFKITKKRRYTPVVRALACACKGGNVRGVLRTLLSLVVPSTFIHISYIFTS